ncbi:MAG TPA: glycosyltransferase [Xanthomonadaceae bacterium]|jgi:glycosyltransferase involved in cell wall biosynthesis|nr:glycosyltransferase [Xanthomonadaceae bacterium]
MRILLLAYEYPPSLSPGALRWRYLSRELAANGHDVVVLAPRLPAAAGAPGVPDTVRVLRTFAGPIVGLVEWNARRKARAPAAPAPSRAGAAAGHLAQGNWKHSLVRTAQALLGVVLFPDARSEWRPWARRALAAELAAHVPDIVISAHEPATTLQLGFAAARRGIPWVVDLGDPVLAPYTPRRWARRALRLERRVCQAATHVVVTTVEARRLLLERHALDPARVSVLTQGFEDRGASGPVAPVAASGDLRLFYGGRFYPFRQAGQLLSAVAGSSGVRLDIASPEPPQGYERFAAQADGRIRYLGHLPHDEVLALQRQADVLVSIGNDGMAAQTPGKLYEYLGAGRPILHLLGAGGTDPAGPLIERLGAGWSCANDAQLLARLLEKLLDGKHNGALAQAQAGTGGPSAFGWSRIGRRYSALVEGLAHGGRK